MKTFLWAGVTLLAFSAAAFAQRPVIYPLRSQNAAVQGVDNAYCYWQAKLQTGVDMAHQPQRPTRTKPLQFAPDAGKGASEPPLPMTPGTSSGGAKAASGTVVAGNAAVPGNSTTVAAAPRGASSHPEVGATSVAGQASGAASASSPASGTAGASSPASGAALTKLPPLPPPEPPMTTYWQAWGDCMQSRGYGVQ